jgi:hypothetical protein
MPVTVGEVSVLFVTVAVFVVVKTLLGVMMFDNTVMVYAPWVRAASAAACAA